MAAVLSLLAMDCRLIPATNAPNTVIAVVGRVVDTSKMPCPDYMANLMP